MDAEVFEVVHDQIRAQVSIMPDTNKYEIMGEEDVSDPEGLEIETAEGSNTTDPDTEMVRQSPTSPDSDDQPNEVKPLNSVDTE